MMIRQDLTGRELPPTDPAELFAYRCVAEGGIGATAIGPRIFASVAHLGRPDNLVYQGEHYTVVDVIEPGDDYRFIIVDRDLPSWTDPCIGKDFTGFGVVYHTDLFIVGEGDGVGVIDGKNYHWGSNSRAKRWGRNGAFQAYWPTCCVMFEEIAACSQDSGYACFIKIDGVIKFLGAFSSANNNPATLGTIYGGNAIAAAWEYDVIKDYLRPYAPPVEPPAPPVVTGPRLEFAVDVYGVVGFITHLEASVDKSTWEVVVSGNGCYTYREPATQPQRFFRARTDYPIATPPVPGT